MNHRSSHSVQPQPLPAEFSQSLRDIDAMLQKQSRQGSIPAGLADRVFAASRPALIEATTPAYSSPRLRLVPAASRSLLHQTPWARLAMAACVVIACMVAFWALQPSPPRSSELAARTGEDSIESRHDLLAMAVDAPHANSATHYEASLSYLLESQNLSVDDLDDLKSEIADFAMLVARF